MKIKLRSPMLLAAASLLLVTCTPATALAAGSGMPGDSGRPGQDGIMPLHRVPRPPMAPSKAVLAPPIEIALRAAQAIAAGCKQYQLGVAVVNADGEPILVYIPDGSHPRHAYTAIRKAYSAITFKANTSTIVTKAQQEPEFAARIKADSNLIGFSGGILLKVGDVTLGAIGVSGAEPGGHDEECGMIGVAAIKDQFK